jgi:hypothetical protein
MNKQHIETSQRLSECRGMGESPVVLVKLKYENEAGFALSRKSNSYPVENYAKESIHYKHIEYCYSWLKIDSQSEWCSFKFLQRCGWKAKSQTLLGWIIEVGRLPTKRSSEKEISTHVLIVTAFDAGDLPLAFILAIILIHEIAPELYAKGIEPLMGE